MSIKSAIDKLTGKSSKNIEDAISKLDIGGGSGGGGLRITITYDRSEDTYALDKSYNEIKTALLNGTYVYAIYELAGSTASHFLVCAVRKYFVTEHLTYTVIIVDPNSDQSFPEFTSTSPDEPLVGTW